MDFTPPRARQGRAPTITLPWVKDPSYALVDPPPSSPPATQTFFTAFATRPTIYELPRLQTPNNFLSRPASLPVRTLRAVVKASARTAMELFAPSAATATQPDTASASQKDKPARQRLLPRPKRWSRSRSRSPQKRDDPSAAEEQLFGVISPMPVRIAGPGQAIEPLSGVDPPARPATCPAGNPGQRKDAVRRRGSAVVMEHEGELVTGGSASSSSPVTPYRNTAFRGMTMVPGHAPAAPYLGLSGASGKARSSAEGIEMGGRDTGSGEGVGGTNGEGDEETDATLGNGVGNGDEDKEWLFEKGEGDEENGRNAGGPVTPAIGNLRWAVLAMACLIMFGNYYAYDLPAALNKPLQDFLNEEDDAYQYQLNLFYSLYSLPNIVLPFLGGFLLDVFGTRRLMTILSALVCLGQIFFSIGVSTKSYFIMHLGRVMFGVGGESLSVAQTRITSKWFKGKEIAFALGVNLSVARLGSVMNDFVSPHLAVNKSVPLAIWFGSITCFISFFAGIILNALDAYGTAKIKASARRLSARRGSAASPGVEGTKRSEGGVHRYPPSIATARTSIALASSAMSPDSRHRGVSRDGGFALHSQADRRPGSPAPAPALAGAHGAHGAAASGQLNWGALLKFHLSFWLVCLIMCLMYATVVPFNTIHSAFLQTKWYKDDPKTAGQVMALPDIISAVLVPFCGTFVDRYGRRVKVLIVCGGLMAIAHVILGFATPVTVPSPLPPLMLLGFSYSLLLTFWPCIPLVVDDRNQATAFGVATAAQNAALVVFPMMVAALVNADKTYFLTEMFFVTCSLLGVGACFWLYWVDKSQLNGILERGKEELSIGVRIGGGGVKLAGESGVAYASLRGDSDSAADLPDEMELR
ncbi:hypothetical protein HDU96_006652 [Phlyctochytrium bullatum]|nr:hypothetical protein HDU96_006652 [Phlyctochytrium bullatum]